jgi:DNA-binding NarL/FixJ family response regulator
MTVIAPLDDGDDRVLVSSESPVILAGLRALVGGAGLGVARALRDTTKLAEGVRSERVSMALVAPMVGNGEPVDPLLASGLDRVHVVVLLAPAAARIHSSAMHSDGCNVVLPLTAQPHEIIRALRRPATNGASPAALRPLLSGIGGQLTTREQDVLDQLAAGGRNRDIAGRLVLSEETVKTHLRRIYRKLGVRSRAEAITTYLEAS